MESLFYFLPCLACITWAISYKLRKKNVTQKILFRLILLCIPYFFTFALYINPSTNYELLSICDFINQPLILIILAVTIIYLDAHLNKKIMEPMYHALLIIPAIIQGSIMWILYLLIGFKKIANFHYHFDLASKNIVGEHALNQIHAEFSNDIFRVFYFFDYIVVDVMAGIMFLVCVWICAKIQKNEGYRFGDIYRLWFKGRKTTPSRAVAYWTFNTLFVLSFLVVFGRTYFFLHPTLGAILSVLTAATLYSLFYCEFYSFLPNYSVKMLTHAELRGENPESQESKEASENITDDRQIVVDINLTDEIVEDNTETEENGESLSESVSDDAIDISKHADVLSPKMTALVERMKEALTDRKIYTDSEVSIDKLAKYLGTNRSTLSPLINQTYEMNFKTLIATLRIEEAKRMLLKDPTLPIEIIAYQCGFKDKVNFFRRFKEITGETPRVWLIKYNGEQ